MKKNIAIIILSIIVLILSGYLVYNNVLLKDKTNIEDNLQTENKEEIVNNINVSQKIVDEIEYYNYSKNIDKNMIGKYGITENDYLEINESGTVKISYTTGDKGQIANFENLDYTFYFKEGSTTYVILSFNNNNKVLIGKKEIFNDSYEFAATESGPVANGGIIFEYKKVN